MEIIDNEESIITLKPDTTGQYIFTLSIKNNDEVDQSTKIITVFRENSFPQQNTHPANYIDGPSNAKINEPVTLFAVTDQFFDNLNIRYNWALNSKPEGSELTLTTTNATILDITPDISGTYVLELVVNLNDEEISRSDFSLTVMENIPPEALIEGPDTTAVLDLLALSGDKSFDENFDPITYSWEITNRPEGSTATLTDASSHSIEFQPDKTGSYSIGLTVNDGLSASQQVIKHIIVTNQSPVASLEPEISTAVGSVLIINGDKSFDPDEQQLTYHWSISSKPEKSLIEIDEANLSKLLHFEPDIAGDYVINLYVSDGFSNSEVVSTVIHVPFLFEKIEYRVKDAEYSQSLDLIVMISGSDNKVYAYDTTTGETWSVVLSLAPSAVSVSPDGLFATIGHYGWISYLDLKQQTVIKTISISTNVFDLVLDNNQNVHITPVQDQWENIRSINLNTEIETVGSGSIYESTVLKMEPEGKYIYLADYDLEKFDISTGSAEFMYSNYDSSTCDNLWISEDGLRIFTACGNTYRSSEDQATDMKYSGKLGEIEYVRHVDHSKESGRIAVIPSKWGRSP